VALRPIAGAGPDEATTSQASRAAKAAFRRRTNLITRVHRPAARVD
jgi:hypothetical protein